MLNVPARLLQAASPFVFALMLETSANLALAIMAVGSVLALAPSCCSAGRKARRDVTQGFPCPGTLLDRRN
uniref:Uncharacterized protein n=1 Tax=Phenylobacterium glaciei TaxID=2803784 RepID=A0A974P6R2_9CAUL|nr:hypothetical protein JKL49_10170 [Phenylobacterium glaciei]